LLGADETSIHGWDSFAWVMLNTVGQCVDDKQDFVAQVTAWYWAWSDTDKWFPSKQFVLDVWDVWEFNIVQLRISWHLLTSLDWQNQVVSGAFCRKSFVMKTLLYGSKMNWPVLLQSSRSGFSLGCQMWGD
jgi:hypothetical protein